MLLGFTSHILNHENFKIKLFIALGLGNNINCRRPSPLGWWTMELSRWAVSFRLLLIILIKQNPKIK